MQYPVLPFVERNVYTSTAVWWTLDFVYDERCLFMSWEDIYSPRNCIRDFVWVKWIARCVSECVYTCWAKDPLCEEAAIIKEHKYIQTSKNTPLSKPETTIRLLQIHLREFKTFSHVCVLRTAQQFVYRRRSFWANLKPTQQTLRLYLLLKYIMFYIIDQIVHIRIWMEPQMFNRSEECNTTQQSALYDIVKSVFSTDDEYTSFGMFCKKPHCITCRSTINVR